MNRQLQDVLRLLGRSFYWIVMASVVGAPAVLAQQTKMPSTKVPEPAADAAAETNQRIAQLAVATTVKQSDYQIGTGDLLGIEVFDVAELTRDARVNESGYISLPLIPTKIRATGLTTFQLQDKIAELLQSNGLITTPQVTVTLKEQHSQPITVIGSVKNPMVIQAVRETTLLQALSQAGGISPDAGNMVIVTRNPATDPANSDASKDPGPAQTFSIRLSDLLDTGDSRFNIPVLGGDVISVPHAGIIYVVGAVNHPGGFVMDNDTDRMTTLKMLSLAGGTTSTAKSKDAVILRKNAGTGKRDEVPVNLDKVLHLKTEDVMLQPSDILFIPDSTGKKALHRAGDVAIGLSSGAALISIGRI